MNLVSKCLPKTAESIDVETFNKIRRIVEVVDSRKRIIDRINSFLSQNRSRIGSSYTIPVLIMRGEWGEGKTASFYTYIRPLAIENGLYAIRANMEEIVNNVAGLLVKSINASLPGENTINYPLLTLYLSLCQSNQIKCSDSDDAFTKVRDYVVGKLKEGYGGVVLFIDEFEELLMPIAAKKTITINGSINESLKEVLGYKTLRKISRDEGRELVKRILEYAYRTYGITELGIYVIYAMTPYAFMAFKTEYEGLSEQTWGKIDRTLDRIDLKPLSRLDSFKVIDALVRYYTGRPSGAVFEDPRLISTLHLISMGNFSSLNQILCQLLRSIDNKITAEDFVRVLKGYKIFTFIGEREVISSNAYDKITGGSRDLVRTLEELMGKLVLSKRLGDEYNLARLSGRNKRFADYYGYPLITRAFIYELSDELLNKALDELAKNVSAYMAEEIPDGKHSEIFSDIRLGAENLIIMSRTGEDAGKYFFVIPIEDYTFNYLLGMYTEVHMSADTIKAIIDELEETIGHPIDGNALMLSGHSMQLLYPPPFPSLLSTCREPKTCMKIWEDARSIVTRRPPELYRMIFNAVNDLIKLVKYANTRFDDFKVKATFRGEQFEGALIETSTKQLRDLHVKEPIKVGIVFANNINDANLAEFRRYIRSILKKYHGLVVLCINCEPKPLVRLTRLERVAVVSLDTQILHDLIAVINAYKKGLVMREVVERFAMRFMDTTGLLDQLTKLKGDLKEEGFIVSDLKSIIKIQWKDRRNLTDLVSLGVKSTDLEVGDEEPRLPYNIESSWSVFKDLVVLKRHDKRTRGLIGLDIETHDKFYRTMNIFLEFLRDNNLYDGKYITPLKNNVCRNIYKMVEESHSRGIKISELKDRLLDATSTMNKDEVIEFYIYFLSSLGLIDREGDYIYPSPSESRRREVEEIRDAILKQLNEISEQVANDVQAFKTILSEVFVEDKAEEALRNLLFIAVCKQAGCKVISPKELERAVRSISDKILSKNYISSNMVDSLRTVQGIVNEYVRIIENGIEKSESYAKNWLKYRDDVGRLKSSIISLLRQFSAIHTAELKLKEIYSGQEHLTLQTDATARQSISGYMAKLLKLYKKCHAEEHRVVKPIKVREPDQCINNAALTIHPISCYMGSLYEEIAEEYQELKKKYIDLINDIKELLDRIGNIADLVDRSILRPALKPILDLLRAESIAISDLQNAIEYVGRNLDNISKQAEEYKKAIKEYNDLINSLRIAIANADRRARAYKKKISELVKVLSKNLDELNRMVDEKDDLLNRSKELKAAAISFIRGIDGFIGKIGDYNERVEEIEKRRRTESSLDKIQGLISDLKYLDDRIIELIRSFDDNCKKFDSRIDRFKDELRSTLKYKIDLIKKTINVLINTGAVDEEELNTLIEDGEDAIAHLEGPGVELGAYGSLYIKLNAVLGKLRAYIDKILAVVLTDDEKKKKVADHILRKIMSAGEPVISYSDIASRTGITFDEYVGLIKTLYSNKLLRDITVKL